MIKPNPYKIIKPPHRHTLPSGRVLIVIRAIHLMTGQIEEFSGKDLISAILVYGRSQERGEVV